MSSDSKFDSYRERRQSLLSPQPVILAVLFVALIGLTAMALQPGFRGGGFVTAALAVATGLIGVLLIRSATGAELARDEGDDDVPLKMSEGGAAGWGVILRAAAVIVGLFALVLFLGMILGLTTATFFIFRMQMQMSLRATALSALVWGTALPVLFGVLLEVPLWPGLIPEIIPRWIGGGVPPPL